MSREGWKTQLESCIFSAPAAPAAPAKHQCGVHRAYVQWFSSSSFFAQIKYNMQLRRAQWAGQQGKNTNCCPKQWVQYDDNRDTSDEQNTKYDNITDTSNDLLCEHSGWTDL